MKKTIFFLMGFVALSMFSCSDMLEVEESRNVDGDKAIDKKTDSLFYAWGIMQAMQQAADMYVLQNEVRGDLIDVTTSASTHLQTLADFTATGKNEYNAAYLYYKVVNNCNNYLAHRDTTLYDASDNVTTEEYAAVLSFRAWAYLQLARQYGQVKFFTEPLTSISEINDKSRNLPLVDINYIISDLLPELEKFADTSVPSYPNIDRGNGQVAISNRLYIPVHVILGEMYLERGQAGDWMKAAEHYYKYLYNNKIFAHRAWANADLTEWVLRNPEASIPLDLNYYYNRTRYWSPATTLTDAYQNYANHNNCIISYIPMATNYLLGQTTRLPEIFGYDYYATGNEERWLRPQLVPSKAYDALADSADYYYVPNVTSLSPTASYSSFKLGDQRRNIAVYEYTLNDSTYTIPVVHRYINTVLYRATTIWLHLAEALNRAGYPDAAFAILKDGIYDKLANSVVTVDSITGQLQGYIQPETMKLFTDSASVVSFLGRGGDVYVTGAYRNYGLHGNGCSDEEGIGGARSLYQLDTIVTVKLSQIELEMGVARQNTKQDTINAVEDLLCDEYAMEFAFEGCRFSDLRRMARHKNEAGLYDPKFGSKWFAKKLADKVKSSGVDLTNEANWNLPLN